MGTSTNSLIPSLSGSDSSLFKVSINRCSNVGANKVCSMTLSSNRGLTPRVAPYLVDLSGASFSISVTKNGSSTPPVVSQEVLFELIPASLSPLSFSVGEKTKNLSLDEKTLYLTEEELLDEDWLFIEDNVDMRELLSMVIRRENYEVKSAVHGKEAIEIIEKGFVPELIIVDYHMPVMNGPEFLDILEKNFNSIFNSVPMVLMTAMSKDEIKGCKATEVFTSKGDLTAILLLLKKYL